MNTLITIKHIGKSFDDTDILRDLSFTVSPHTITAIVGPNASGKSTLLNMIAGIISPDRGEIRGKEYDQSTFSYMFQNYRDSLLPWRTNYENLVLPLEIQKKTSEEMRCAIDAVQELVPLAIDWSGYPASLSGGQKQLLAFMRALITMPAFLCIDEPFSSLDYENNLRLRECLQQYFVRYSPTILVVTHNIEEAVHLAGTIVVFSQRPTRVSEVIDNPLPYPRTVAVLKGERFHKIKARVLAAFLRSTQV